MAKIGLALSGGGFRGTLFHLGIIRFLRDANVLRDITHITAVSGGSILAAHLVLNWSRYNGSDEDFENASREILNFVQLDVRNRIVRRFPFAAVVSALRWVTRRPYDRRYSRTGLLEHYYAKYLFGQTCLYELPSHPELHLLSTNLSEGCICSFTRSGMIMQRRLPGDRVQFERIHAGLASVPLAVAASSAFPAFFPPIRLRAADIGASLTAFSQQTFTDGGVFDNLGVRAFRFIERCWSEECRPTEADGREMEVEEIGEHSEAHSARNGETSDSTRRDRVRRSESQESRASATALIGPPGPDVAPGRPNRDSARRDGAHQIPPSALAQFDAVIVSDAGAKLATRHDSFGGGLIRTALRASDILMDRVWQLEKEIFGATPEFLFVPIHQVVERDTDPHSLEPVVQRQAIGIRTDLDRFSRGEIRTLVQHGYSVMRQAARSRPDLFGTELPEGAPWDPYPPKTPPSPRPPGRPNAEPAEATKLARELQQSAFRRVVSTLLDWRDGMTYLFLPVMLFLLLIFPSFAIWSYLHVSRDERALGALAASDPDGAKMIALLRDGPVKSLKGIPVQDVDRLEPPDYRGFRFLSDGHIVDYRGQDPGLLSRVEGRNHGLYQYRRLLVRRIAVEGADTHLRLPFASKAGLFTFACHNPELHPVLKRIQHPRGPAGADDTAYRLELDLDFSQVPVGLAVDVVVEGLIRSEHPEGHNAVHAVPHTNYGDTKVATMWIFLPSRRNSGRLDLVASATREPRETHSVRPTRQFEAARGSVIGWQIIDPEPETTYEARWILD
jgi:hypothetical protein